MGVCEEQRSIGRVELESLGPAERSSLRERGTGAWGTSGYVSSPVGMFVKNVRGHLLGSTGRLAFL